MSLTVKDLSPDQRVVYNEISRWVDANPAPVGGKPVDGFDEDDFDFDSDDESEFEADASYEGPPGAILTLGGFAGTGKSTLVSLIAAGIELPAFCAYTGKATSVLRRKLSAAGTATVGTQRKNEGKMSNESKPYCGTIHSLIYRPCDCREPQVAMVLRPCPGKDCPGETTWDGSQSVCAKGHVGLVKDVAALNALKPGKRFVYAEKDESGRCKLCHGKEWLRREALDRNYNLIIVDEASMVDDMMIRDLRSYGVPILAVGDHGQLPPVGGVGSLMKSPNLRLEQIHRQAEGNPIIALSKMIRETGRMPDSMPGDEVKFGRLRFVDQILEERYADASAARLLEMGVACYTNKRRQGLNVAARRALGHARVGRELPRKGEHVICLRNMKEDKGRPPVANGMRGVLQSNVDWKLIKDEHGDRTDAYGTKSRQSKTQLLGSIEFPEDGIPAHDYEMFAPQFGREKTFSSPEELERETGIHSFSMAGSLFDFGYAMTVHKMQGSSFDDLVVCAERPGPVGEEDWRRWLYTAVTRAAKKLTVLR